MSILKARFGSSSIVFQKTVKILSEFFLVILTEVQNFAEDGRKSLTVFVTVSHV